MGALVVTSGLRGVACEGVELLRRMLRRAAAKGCGSRSQLLASGRRVRIVSRRGRAELAVAEVLAADATDRMVCQGASVAYHRAAAPYLK
jgi:hypothetical protein